MNIIVILFLLGLAVMVSGFPRPIGHDQSVIRNNLGGNGFDGSRNFGNWGFGHMGRQWDSPNNGGNYIFGRSVGNGNSFGASGQNSAYMYDSSGPTVSDPTGRISGDLFRNIGRDGIELGGYLAFE
ncbi:hypothetical protein ACJMK2_009113 [Sinanodonta woodiana]|uniref:Uncharacterized protein n=1 Tax=Sinanodonta woodiana TaxID=1069815 RepID=A0ABD3VBA0_SINWO